MLNALLVSPTTLLAPPEAASASPDELRSFEQALHHAEYRESESGVEVAALDANGELIGWVSVYVDAEFKLHVVSEYDDGYSETIVYPDSTSTTERSLDPSTVERRAQLIDAVLDQPTTGPLARNSWMKCGKRLLFTGISCGLASPVGCVGGAIGTACGCVPMIIKEFRDQECPWE